MGAIVLWIINNETGLDLDKSYQFSQVFPLFRGAIIFSLYSLMLGWNIYVWNYYSIDYREIMKFRINIPSAMSFLAQGVMLTVLFLISLELYIVLESGLVLKLSLPDNYVPLITWGLLFLWLVFPLNGWYHNSGRTFLAKVLLSSFMSPFSKVEFKHVFVINQLVSMVIPLVDLEYAVCYYTNTSSHINCANKLRFSPLIVMLLPFFIRTMQCLRIVWDSGTIHNVQLVNAGKYFSSMVVILVNYAYKDYGGYWFYIWIGIAVFSTLYGFCWDIIIDWGFFDGEASHFGLRRKLIYKKPIIYYGVISLNMLLRLTWVFTISPTIVSSMMRPELFTMILGIGEIYRRVMWNFLRMEWEQLLAVKKDVDQKTRKACKKLIDPLHHHEKPAKYITSNDLDSTLEN
mmetsp:Transcript_27400/g.49318  ORF Transcript_27400/g.49318 Transcript_27400/m.49318 type:complete len:402 (-) Transcript_27400:401-1606(-)